MKANGRREGLHSTMGELTLNTDLLLTALSGHLKGVNYRMARRSIEDKRELKRRLCSCVILSVLAAWLL